MRTGSRTFEAPRSASGGTTREQERQQNEGEGQRVFHESCPDGSAESTARIGVGANLVAALPLPATSRAKEGTHKGCPYGSIRPGGWRGSA